jgi:hypothetical protein
MRGGIKVERGICVVKVYRKSTKEEKSSERIRKNEKKFRWIFKYRVFIYDCMFIEC